jgi:Leu/Phe-tRNA-protein transferase
LFKGRIFVINVEVILILWIVLISITYTKGVERGGNYLLERDKSSGTKYENAKEEIIDLTKVHIQKHLRKRIKNSSIIDDVFYHILANNFLEGVLEIARHYKNEEWANNMVELLSKQYFYGINFLVK